MTQLSENLKKILDGKVFVAVATIQPDGSPQVSPVWVKRDGDELLISTTVDRRKALNLRRDPRVTVLVHPPEEPYTYAELRGTATLTTEGAQELIDELSLQIRGQELRGVQPAVRPGRRTRRRPHRRPQAGRPDRPLGPGTDPGACPCCPPEAARGTAAAHYP